MTLFLLRSPPRMFGRHDRSGIVERICRRDAEDVAQIYATVFNSRVKGKSATIAPIPAVLVIGKSRFMIHPAALKRARARAVKRSAMRKLIAFDDDTAAKLTQLARDRMATFQELADEAFADLLKKHGIPIDLKDALRKSAAVSGESAKVIPLAKRKKPTRRERE